MYLQLGTGICANHLSVETGASNVETDVCVASPRPDSLTLRGLVEPARTLLKGHLMLQDNYGLYTDIESTC